MHACLTLPRFGVEHSGPFEYSWCFTVVLDDEWNLYARVRRSGGEDVWSVKVADSIGDSMIVVSDQELLELKTEAEGHHYGEELKERLDMIESDYMTHVQFTECYGHDVVKLVEELNLRWLAMGLIVNMETCS